MSSTDLQPQVPGEQPASQPPEIIGNPAIDLPAIAELSIPELEAQLGGLSVEELLALETLEVDGKNRAGALASIAAEIDARQVAQAAAAKKAAKQAEKAKPDFSRPVLTKDGWLVPEPKA